ncbi:MAG TPA: hypothetical protein VK982_13540 [Bacteroidales bacterium]|nr:hypothetical protein [Bacteroidales bacterium]
MNVKQVFLLFIFLSLASALCYPQSYPPFYFHDQKIDSAKSNKLFLQIDNTTFFKNNEYFGDIAKGYTLLGFHLTPQIVYQPNENSELRFGTQLLSYYGREDEMEVSLLLSFQYQLHKNLSLTLGNIKGTLNHRLIEPLFDYERFFTHNIESGIQFLWQSEKIFADLWLDWEQQIFYDDLFQEKFNVGLSVDYTIFAKNNYSLSIPFQNLIRHLGGQINNNEEPLVTIFNNATGFTLTKKFSGKILHHIQLSSYLVNYQDLSPNKQQMFIDGTGSYTTLEILNNRFNFLTGYWYGKQFIAPLGNPLYETYSRTNIFVEEPVRQLIIAKINYHQNIFNGINLDVRFEPYFDLLNGNFEYNYGLVIIFKENFFLKEIKKH